MYPKVKPDPRARTTDYSIDSRRERLRRLTESREFKAKLVSKLKERYGEHNEIEDEINKLVKNDALCQASIYKLENEFKTKFRKSPLVKLEPLNQSHHSPDLTSIRHEVRQTAVTPEPSHTKKPMTAFTSSEDQWATLANYEALQVKDEAMAKKRKDRERKLKIRQELNFQILQKQTDKKRSRQEMKEYEEHLRLSFEKLQQADNLQQEERKAKRVAERRVLDEYLKLNQDRRAQEARLLKEQEQNQLNALTEEEKLEAKRKAEKRKKEREIYKQVLKDNEKRQQNRKVLEAKDREEEVKLAEEYGRIIEEQELKRVEAHNARLERQQKLIARMEDTVVKEKSKKAKEEDYLLMKQTELREKREAEEEVKRKQRQFQIEQEMRNFQQSQIEERERVREMERRAQQHLAKEWSVTAARQAKEVEAEKEAQRQKALKHADLLRLQILEHKKKSASAMNPVELAFNKEKLKAARKRLAE